MTSFLPRRPSLALVPALLLACNPGTAMETSATDATGSTGDDPTTTGGPPVGCGDGEVEWAFDDAGSEGLGARALAVAVDGAGRIVVAGGQTDGAANEVPMVLVLDPGGAELWRKPLAGPNEPDILHDVVVDDAGRIVVAGREFVDGAAAGMLRAYAADGAELWRFDAPGQDPGMDADIGGLALGHGALYSAGTDTNALVIRRHDLTTGAAAWQTRHDEGLLLAYDADVAVAGDDILVVARVAFADASGHPFVLRLAGDGTIQSTTVETESAGWWLGVAAIGDAGERVLAGEQYNDLGEGIAVRRAASDGAEVWSSFFDPTPQSEEFGDVAVAPDGRILVVGVTNSEDLQKSIPSVRCLAGDGSGHLQLPFAFGPEEYEDEPARGGAFGPGFMVVVGSRMEAQDVLWVRKYAAG